jgi:uncharacterized DUF497 family protein
MRPKPCSVTPTRSRYPITIFDAEHSADEDRFIDIGLSGDGRDLVVVYTERNERIHIIGGRLATARESKQKESKMNSDKSERQSQTDEMLDEYAFSSGVRGKHHRAYANGYTVEVHRADGTTEVRKIAPPTGTVVLDPDVRKYFPDAAAVNRALRGLIALLPRGEATPEPR